MTISHSCTILCSEGYSLPRPGPGLQTVRRYIIESRAFIKNATRLIKEINDSDTVTMPQWRETMQKEINQLFSSLQNPTLPSAYRLRDAARKNGFTVHPQVLQRLSALEHITS